MAVENEHINTLIAARDRLTADRRALAEVLAAEYKRGHSEDMRDAFFDTQNTIEAIDRAIADETRIQSGQPLISGAIGFRSAP